MSDRAVTVSRGFGYPARSDVSASSRFYHSTANGDDHDTFAELPYFFPTRLDWVYDNGNEGDIIGRAKDNGWRYTGALNSILPDVIGTSQRLLGRDKTIAGTLTPLENLPNGPAIGDYWSEDYYNIAVDHLESMISNGADAVQVDDPGGNYDYFVRGLGGYGDATDLHFRGWIYQNSTAAERLAWGIPASFTTTYRQWVVSRGGESQLPAALKEKYRLHLLEGLERYFSRLRLAAKTINGGVSMPFSCNYGSNVSWDESRIWANFGMAETRTNNIDAKKIRDWLRLGEAIGKSVLLSPPRYDAQAAPSTYKDLARRCIATTYAMGGVMMVPWDVWQANNGGPRYYGTPSQYADLFGFIRALPGYFNGYEEVFARNEGIGISEFGYELTPMWINYGSGRVVLSVRARPGQPTQPLMVHLVEWGTAAPCDLIIDPNQIFNGAPFTAHLFRPTAYNAQTHQTAVNTGVYTSLRQFQLITPTIRTDGRHQYAIPALSPWGVLRLQKQ